MQCLCNLRNLPSHQTKHKFTLRRLHQKNNQKATCRKGVFRSLNVNLINGVYFLSFFFLFCKYITRLQLFRPKVQRQLNNHAKVFMLILHNDSSLQLPEGKQGSRQRSCLLVIIVLTSVLKSFLYPAKTRAWTSQKSETESQIFICYILLPRYQQVAKLKIVILQKKNQ